MDSRNSLPKQLKPLYVAFEGSECEAGDTAAGPRLAGNYAGLDWVNTHYHDDWCC